ncbi:hypothetical protein [Haloarcula marismortui]|uniref:hypothetical protein n=1 Tax=Haloarcula marismortui TaxID=2238 RepID=UPI000677884C|nr:hypothetical protein [Haloarcula marismortui]
MTARQYEALGYLVVLVGLPAVVVATVDASAAVSALLTRPFAASADAVATFVSQPFANPALAGGITAILGLASLLLRTAMRKRDPVDPYQEFPLPPNGLDQEDTVDE